MNNNTIKSLLMKYDKKRRLAQQKAEKEKYALYKDYPKLEEIDNKLSSLAISTMKKVIIDNDLSLVNDLNNQIENLKKERQKLLDAIGSRANQIVPNYECSKCSDTGYIVENGSSVMCNCLKQKLYDIEYNKANMNKLEVQNFEHFNLAFYDDNVNTEKYLTDISPRENMKLILDVCHDFINNFDDVKEKNLLFTGKTGLGKTFLSGCIANEILKKGKTVLYQTSSVMLDTIIGYKFNKPTVPTDIYDHLLNVDLLIIDDLGTEGANNLKLVELFNLLNARLLSSNKSTKTIISTNLSLQNIAEQYDERIISRIVGNYNVCYFFGDDIRFINK